MLLVLQGIIIRDHAGQNRRAFEGFDMGLQIKRLVAVSVTLLTVEISKSEGRTF